VIDIEYDDDGQGRRTMMSSRTALAAGSSTRGRSVVAILCAGDERRRPERQHRQHYFGFHFHIFPFTFTFCFTELTRSLYASQP
jgi:hypothetical protein